MIQLFAATSTHAIKSFWTSFFGGEKEEKKGRTTEIFTPHGIQRKWEIPTFEDNLNTYPRYLLPYPDATLQLTDIHNGIYLHNMVCHNFCHCLFSQIYNIFRVQTITSDDYKISTQTEYIFH